MSGRSALILVPTEFEIGFVRRELEKLGTVELCGFGLPVSAARTAQLLATHRPKRVILVGIAGGLSQDVVVGQAYNFTHVACWGIGVGENTNHRVAGDLGWKHWAAAPNVGDVLELQPGASGPQQDAVLLSVASASGCPEETEAKLNRYPAAQAEDMEGFSVAAACRLEQVPLSVVRGISNRAGDRNHEHWQIETAMRAAAEITREILKAN